jgi:acyl-coenzyme A thioesterase PaaI-like protein
MIDDYDERVAFAAAVRDLNHAFVGHNPAPGRLRELTAQVVAIASELGEGPDRDRLALMMAARDAADANPAANPAAGPDGGDDVGAEARMSFVPPKSGFEDRAVAGRANPTSIEFEIAEEGDDVVARFQLRKAFEGAPNRAHGGIVAAAFDDVTGWIIGKLREPSFTGELTVRFNAPVPVDSPLEIRTRLVGRERRKLFITAEMRAGDVAVATCQATYITVDPSLFAVAPEPR